MFFIVIEAIVSRRNCSIWSRQNVLCGTILRQKRYRCSWKQWWETNQCFISIFRTSFMLVDFIMLLNHIGIRIHSMYTTSEIDSFGPPLHWISWARRKGVFLESVRYKHYTVPKDRSQIHCILFTEEEGLVQVILKWKRWLEKEYLNSFWVEYSWFQTHHENL
jgi:hypothetical protein